MSHDVIMPALGMAQDSGLLVSWFKQPGDAVAIGDALFEVETDKATMEVEAQHAGFLTQISAKSGDEVPVGQVIAVIAASQDAAVPIASVAEEQPPQFAAKEDALPEGQSVIMPALGMTQDTGLLVNWLKQSGDAVSADEVLFEVETDKSTMEVTAGFDGFVAALLAAAGEDVPVGHDVAIISSVKPETPVQRTRGDVLTPVTEPSLPATQSPVAPPPGDRKRTEKSQLQPKSGRILASPKTRRLAHERGLDLQKLVEAGHVQPFHVSDLAELENISANTPVSIGAPALRRLTAQISAVPFGEIMSFVSEKSSGPTTGAVISGLAAGAWASGGSDIIVAYRHFSKTQLFSNPHGIGLGKALPDQANIEAQILIQDLRQSAISSIENCSDGLPTLTILSQGDQFSFTFECGAGQMSADAALSFLTEFAGRMEQPLRHLL